MEWGKGGDKGVEGITTDGGCHHQWGVPPPNPWEWEACTGGYCRDLQGSYVTGLLLTAHRFGHNRPMEKWGKWEKWGKMVEKWEAWEGGGSVARGLQ